jgi:hypothetical protein
MFFRSLTRRRVSESYVRRIIQCAKIPGRARNDNLIVRVYFYYYLNLRTFAVILEEASANWRSACIGNLYF